MDIREARESGFTVATRHPWELARLAIIEKLIARHVMLDRGAVVLDVGCGDTFVVEQLALANPEASFYAIDTAFTEELLTRYRERSRPNVFIASSLDALGPTLDRPVALVLLMDVLEHISDDGQFLAMLLAHPAIRRGTQVLVTVPSFQSLFCSHDIALGHFRRYSSRQLRQLMEGSGLTLLESGYLFSSLLPVRLVQVFRERFGDLRGTTPRSGLLTWKGSAELTTVMQRLLVFDAAVSRQLRRIGLTVPGLSTYAICRKSA